MRKVYLFCFAAVAALLLLPVMRNRIRAVAPVPPAASPPAAPRLTREDAPGTVHLGREAQARLGVRTVRLAAVRERRWMTLPAVVLPVQQLVSLVSAYQSAAAALRKAQIAAQVSRQEYARLQDLYRHQRNASAKAVQSAAGTYRGDQVDVRMARENLQLAAAAIRQGWGDAIAAWVARDANSLHRVLDRREALVEMTLPSGENLVAPRHVLLDLPAGPRASATLVSAFPQVDPRVQGMGYLYACRVRPALAPGLNLLAHFGLGALAEGVTVPPSAVVWLQGAAWAYVAVGRGTFERREVSTSVPEPGGWFVRRGFAPGDSVVTRGAEQLLGVESAAVARAPSGSAGGDD